MDPFPGSEYHDVVHVLEMTTVFVCVCMYVRVHMLHTWSSQDNFQEFFPPCESWGSNSGVRHGGQVSALCAIPLVLSWLTVEGDAVHPGGGGVVRYGKAV